MGRRVWSDPAVSALLPRFVLAADEVWRLQNEADPECRFFRRAVLGSEVPSKGTLQGTYVFAPSGRLLARRNTNDPAAIAELLEGALEAWAALPEGERALADPTSVAAGFRWEDAYPADGLVLRRTARDLPASGDPTEPATGRFNRDAVWFSAGEARSFVPETREPGASRALPEALARRLACLVLVDNVRGQTIPYHPSEDAGSRVTTRVTAVDGDRVSLSIEGHTAAVAEGPWRFDPPTDWAPPEGRRTPHSITTKVLGAATYDAAAGRFTAFELVALGERRGRTINQARTDEAPSTLGFLCELAPEGWRVPPTFIDVYGADWLPEPD